MTDLKVVCISDTHNQLDTLNIPDGDVLVHAGDFSMMGTEEEVVKFFEDFSALPHYVKICIAGNHDFMPEKDPGGFRALLPLGITYLEDTSVTIEGVKFYGTPWVQNLPRWAFNIDDVKERAKKWEMIPDDVDVLITHGPPYGILDLLKYPRAGEDPHVGCSALNYEVLERIKPKYNVFGHIHEARSTRKIGETTFINASILDEKYRIKNEPYIFNIGEE